MGQNILLVGCGNMGFAMLSGWIAQDAGHSFHVVEPNEELRARAADAGASAFRLTAVSRRPYSFRSRLA